MSVAVPPAAKAAPVFVAVKTTLPVYVDESVQTMSPVCLTKNVRLPDVE